MDGTHSKWGMVLAAGMGTRMGRPKATLECRGTTLIVRAVESLRAAGCQGVVGVVNPCHGYWHIDEGVFDVLVVNSQPERGQGVSVVMGAKRIPENAWVVVMPVDTLPVSAETLHRLFHVDAKWPNAIVKPVYAKRGGHPVVVANTLLRKHGRLVESRGLRTLQRLPGMDVHRVDVDDPSCIRDIDTLDDYIAYCCYKPVEYSHAIS